MHSDLSEKFVVTACEDSLVRLFSIKENNLEFLTQLVGHKGIVTQALFINQGELIASCDFEGKLIIWKLENSGFVKRAEVQVENGPIYDISVRFIDAALTVFCGCENGKLKTISFDLNLKPTIREEEIHRYGVISVSSNAEYVLTGGIDCSVALIKNENSENINENKSNSGIEYFRHHTGAVNAVAIAPYLDEERIIFATASEDGKLVFIKKDGDKIEKQEISIGEPCYVLDWNKTGFVLTVGFGEGGFKSYILGENDEFEEVPMENKK